MLNDGWDEGMTADESDAAATEMYRDSHPCCLSCEQPGCLREDCPSGSCDVPALVRHDGELMHHGCVAAWDRHIANRCTGDVCNCDACPEAIDAEVAAATEPTKVEAYEPIDVSAGRWWSRLASAAVVLLALALGSVGCAHGPAPVVETETVGQLSASYHSIAVAPVHHDAPPQLGFVAGSDDDDVSSVATTVTRVDAGGDAAPAVVAKDQGLKMGDGR